METKELREADVPKLKKRFLLKWGSLNLSQSGAWILIGFISLYATDVMGLGVGAVGIAILISKLFDGVTDIIVGVMIDRTRSKLGKARPYTLGIIGFWISIALAFSMPSMSRFVGIIYLTVMYILIYSVFGTFVACAETPYLSNVLDDPRQSMSANSFSGVVTAIGSLAFSIVLPQLIASAGEDPGKWRVIAWSMAVPLALIGCIRFLGCKEKVEKLAYSESVAKKNAVSTKEMIRLLLNNKYMLILSFLLLISTFGSNLGALSTSYYSKYIMGDIGVGSVLALAMLPLIIAMAFAPVLVRKFGMKKVIYGVIFMGVAGSLLRLVNVENLGVVFLSSVLSNMGFPAFTIFVNTMVLDCMDYGEYQYNIRLEGSLASVQSVFNKIGTAFGTAAGGMLLAWAGYDGTLEVQSKSALNMIVGLATWIPVILLVLFFITYLFYDLDKKLPGIRRELESKRA
jgi:sugar (glycoside-pentoside-hexuronide) transporter